MDNPYKVLGIDRNASDDEVKRAYKELVKKYHPDQYQDNPLADVAAEKMSDINAAYDQIMTERRSGGAYGGGFSGASRTYSYAYNSAEIRRLIQSGSVTQAEQLLGNVSTQDRDAEWYFLMGSVCYKRGWLNDAYTHFAKAYQMEPSNAEYSAAISQMNRQRSGYMNGSPVNRGASSDMNQACDCCTNLICADCCCECMGGDLIPCC
ncbi:MAG: J domain-containing protein [Ruminococcus sp.]|nr:J domain-containing protein [Ruminococcus sp.]